MTKLSDLPPADREGLHEGRVVSKLWASGERTVRLRVEGQRARLDVFSGKKHVMGHDGSISYAVGYILAFLSCPQPR